MNNPPKASNIAKLVLILPLCVVLLIAVYLIVSVATPVHLYGG